MRAPFQNNPPIDWSQEENQAQMKAALRKVRKELGRTYPIIIGGQEFWKKETIESVNPANYRQVVGWAVKADTTLAEKAVLSAREAQQAWRRIPAEKRAEYLFAAAQIMRQRKFELMAWAVLEAGKNWLEADGDISEAIDFLEYYGREIIKLASWRPTPVQIPGEINEFRYVPKGRGLVLGIWNFILAINAGMTSAPLVAGNSVIFKPASLTPVMGYKLVEIYHQAGLPPGLINYLPGSGEEIGEYLVKHAGINFIVLTGSKAVGRRVIRLAGENPPEGALQKQVIAETGGKDAIIVDSDADLDRAVEGTKISAFGFQGQKCSACSRVIVLQDIYERFLARLIEASRSLPIASPEEPGQTMGPLIDQKALEKVKRYVELGKKEGRLVYQGRVPPELEKMGYYHGPVIFSEVNPASRLAQEEIFGPVLAVIKANNLDEAIKIANQSEYGLTGGGFSRQPAHLKRMKEELEVGNKYFNRKIVGSMVGRQPFGGYKCSGTGVQAGGPDYLKQFMNTEVACEDIMCRGFAPTSFV